MNIGAGWTDQRVTDLKSLFAEGRSASQIAAELGGVTRSSVLGKLFRLGLSKKHPCKPTRPTIVPSPARTAPFRKPRQPPARPTTADGIELDHVLDLPADQSLFACTIHQLTDETCRWPIGEPAHDMKYCGAQRVFLGAYCSRHAALAYRKPDRSPMKLASRNTGLPKFAI